LWGRKRKPTQYLSMDLPVTKETEFIFLRLLTRCSKLMPKIKTAKAGYNHLERTRTSSRRGKLFSSEIEVS